MIYGLKGARWAQMTSDEDKAALPKYEEAQDLGGINSANVTLNFAEASAYADNAQKIRIREFTDGSIESGVLYQEIALAAQLLGCAVDEAGALWYGGEDNQPFGGLGFYRNLMDANKKKYYEAVFFPKVQAYIEGEDNQTKEDSINLNYESCNFYIFQSESEHYQIRERFDTETEAEEYIEKLFTGEITPPAQDSIQPQSAKAATTSAKATSTKKED